MKILVIGGNGFIGSKVSYTLLKNGHRVTILDNKKNKKTDKNIRFIYGIIRFLNAILTC